MYKFFFVLLCLPLITKGQGNLQFNQVKMVGSTAETVPAGKVWKIESAPLTVKNGIRVPPSFIIGTDTIILGYDSYTTSILENVKNVRLEWKGNNYGPYSTAVTNCYGWIMPPINGSTNVKVKISGISTGANILEEDLSFSNIPNINSTSFTSLGTIALSSSGNNSVTSFSVDFKPESILQPPACSNCSSAYVYGLDYSFRIVFLLQNGNSVVYQLGKVESACGVAPAFSLSGPTISTETRSRPEVTTNFPIWIPAGTQVKTISNIGKLSIMEFNVTQ
jgi:hypothetical protein